MRMILIIAAAAALSLGACEPRPPDTQKKGAVEQENTMVRARAAVPTPQTRNFLTRESVAKWMKRQDTPDHPHYIYLFSMTGAPIGYYVAQSRPVNICTFLTPPETQYDVWGGGPNPLGTAPGLDGVYYGKGGCNQWFFFDAATDAMIEVTTDVFGIITADQPLKIDAAPMQVEVSGKK